VTNKAHYKVVVAQLAVATAAAAVVAIGVVQLEDTANQTPWQVQVAEADLYTHLELWAAAH
jgi:hypothetical protein